MKITYSFAAGIFFAVFVFVLGIAFLVPALAIYPTASEIYHQGVKPNGSFRTPFFAWGDRLTAGAGTTLLHDFPSQITLIYGRNVYNRGFGGARSTEILEQFYKESKESDNIIIWIGRNNFSQTDQILADIRSMVAKSSGHFLVLGILNADAEGERRGERGWQQINTLNSHLKTEYGDKFVPIREILIGAASPSDTDDVAKDVVPRSLRSDVIHLNDEGEAIVAYHVEAKLREKGW